jgi:hypothetical protein
MFLFKITGTNLRRKSLPHFGKSCTLLTIRAGCKFGRLNNFYKSWVGKEFRCKDSSIFEQTFPAWQEKRSCLNQMCFDETVAAKRSDSGCSGAAETTSAIMLSCSQAIQDARNLMLVRITVDT